MRDIRYRARNRHLGLRYIHIHVRDMLKLSGLVAYGNWKSVNFPRAREISVCPLPWNAGA